MEMRKTENVVIKSAVAMVCPLMLFVLFWWSTAVISRFYPLSDGWIAAAAFTGLAIGASLDWIFLTRWVARFYTARHGYLILLYLFASVITTAFNMGLPLGNLMLGILAGIYTGRRALHGCMKDILFAKSVRRSAQFTAAVTGWWGVVIGILALREKSIIESLSSVGGNAYFSSANTAGIGVVLFLSLVLAGLQYWCTRTAAWKTFAASQQVD